jgi:hypothetical protein
MMKSAVPLAVAFAAFTLAASAETITGFIADAMCAGNMGAKVASETHARCAEKCIKEGAAAVLVTPEGKVYKLDDQRAALEHAGQNVKVNGTVTNGSIKVTSIAANRP